MNLQGRELTINTRGEDVRLLQEELRQLGFMIGDTDGFYGAGTHRAIVEFQESRNLAATGVVDEETARRINTELAAAHPRRFVVKGEVRNADGTPHAGGLVRAFDRDMRSEELLFEIPTNDQGFYQGTFTPDQFRRAEKKSADLRVCACTQDGRELASSPILFNAFDKQSVITVNHSIGGGEFRGPSEYEAHTTSLIPIMQGLHFEELREDAEFRDITFLSTESDIEQTHIAFLALAHRFFRRTGIPPEIWYAFLRQGLPPHLPAIVGQHPHVLQRTLEKSFAENRIPLRLRSEMDSILELLKEVIVKLPYEEADSYLGSLFRTSLPTRDMQVSFLHSYINKEGSIQDFWRELRQKPEFSESVDQIQETLQLNILTKNHLPLINEIQRMKREGVIASLKDLAGLDSQSWLELIHKQVDGRVIGFPSDTPGESDDSKARTYAAGLAQIIEEAYPTAVIEKRLREDEFPDKEDLLQFLNNNPDFDFHTTRIHSFLVTHPESLQGITNRESVTERLKSMQRLLKVAPQYGQMKVLLMDGIHSAQSIARMGESVFLKSYSAKLGGQTKTKMIYARAHFTAAMALTLFGKYGSAFHTTNVTPASVSSNQMMHSPNTQVSQGVKSIMEAIPNWTTLFGSPVLCECEHCRSVYSPAAYLVDVFWAFLKNVPSALDRLFERRPDLQHIELSCENTNTPLPYVDLVNEILENAVFPVPVDFIIALGFQTDLDNGVFPAALAQEFANQGISLSGDTVVSVIDKGDRWNISDGGWRYTVKRQPNDLIVLTVPQTTGTPQELSANPEYINPNAYHHLAKEFYPFDLPFHLWMEEARIYLDHLGIRRHELMEAFYKGEHPSEWTDLIIALEYLRFTNQEKEIISGASSHPGWEFWGLDLLNNEMPDPADPNNTLSVGWIEALRHVSVFLHKSGLRYTELTELLGTNYINPNNTLFINAHSSVPEEEKDTCDPSRLIIDSLDPAAPLNESTLNRAHRFIRLQRKLDWSISELDQTLTASEPTALDDSFFVKLSHIKRLRDQLKVPLIRILSWWTAMEMKRPANGAKSLYEEVFLNKSIIHPVDEAFHEDRLLAGTGKLSEHIPALMAALRLSESDVSILTKNEAAQTAVNIPQSEIQDDALKLANLSQMYRISSFSRALKMSVPQFLALKALTGIDPFDPTHTEQTLRFVEKALKLRSSGFKIHELDYLLRHWPLPESASAPGDEQLALILDGIRSGLQKIAAVNVFAPDPEGTLVKQKLSVLLSGELVDKAMSLLDGSWNDTAGAKDFIDAHFAEFIDTTEAKDQLIGPPPALNKKEDRFAYVLGPLLLYLRRTLSERHVKQQIAETLKLEAKTAEQLLTKWVDSPVDPNRKSISDFLALSFAEADPGTEITLDSFPDQFKTLALLHKIALILNRMKATPEQLIWLFEYGPAAGWLDLQSLPLTPSVSAMTLFTGWERLVDLFRLRETLPMREKTLSELFVLARDSQTTLTDLLKLLSERTRWTETDLQFLTGAQGFNLAFPAAYQDERAFLRLASCFSLLKRLGVSAEQGSQWIQSDVLPANSRSMKQAAKAKYDNEQWLNIAKPLRDALREKQRAALVSYLAAHPNPATGQTWKDANGLYSHFLIDVEMDPCMMTSRIKQAISSMQLFVQRCLMNLEEDLSIPTDLARQWKWMKNYRVWEANRKVFLYPENWIEPELRSSKSPFFKDLENQLLQNEMTMDTAEQSFLNYLEKLNDVGHLEIVGMYHQLEYPGSSLPILKQSLGVSHSRPNLNVLHVFGRTRGTPHIYYYRRRIESSRWTPWQKVDVDIEGNHLLPLIWNRRLHVMWPVFTEKTKEKPIPKKDEEGQRPSKYWEIQAAWSEFKNGKWSAKKISEASLSLQDYGELKKEQLTFKAYTTVGGDLIFRCYIGSLHGLASAGELVFVGCGGVVFARSATLSGSFVPFGTHPENMLIVEGMIDVTDFPLYLPLGETSQPDDIEQNFAIGAPTLNKTPGGPFSLLTPHQDISFICQRPFFFQDDHRTFFIVPSDQKKRPSEIFSHDAVELALSGYYHQYFLSDEPTNPLSPVTQTADPLIFDASVAAESVAGGVSDSGAVSMSLRFSPVSQSATTILNEDLAKAALQALPAFTATKTFLFRTFYHPYVCEFTRQLNRDGIDGLLQRSNQLKLLDKNFFKTEYEPDKVSPQLVKTPYPIEEVDFAFDGSYSLYNWELFFHAVLLIADRMSKNQRFEEAQRWFHYIFDPTDRSTEKVPARFWKVRPFFENSDALKTIEQLLKLLAASVNDPSLKDDPDIHNLIQQVDEWRKNPFNPHMIAELRITPYQKTVVMKYLDNLIAWADQLFRRDTIESINEATQLYVLAAEILGERPEKVQPRGKVPIKTYKELEPELDAFSNFLTEIEHLAPEAGEEIALSVEDPPMLPQFNTLYFCIPNNEKLLGYWDTVEDRLFKIRHCMTIEGVVRHLPLFEPPIEPGLLVKAFAMGVDISSILNDINAPLPHYRFRVLLQKAFDLCNDVKALASALLSALEKKDAEELALLRSSQEIQLLNALRQVKEMQIEEAKESLEGVKKSKILIQARRDYYRDIEKISENEQLQMDQLEMAHIFNMISQGIQTAVAGAHVVPNFDVGTAGWAASPMVKASFGGNNLGSALQSVAGLFSMISAQYSYEANMASIEGGHDRRWEDWKQQEKLANKELDQIDRQIAAAQIRVALAEKDLTHHDQQVENAKEVDEYMRNKFTNADLYDWMTSQIAAVHFQSYQLAFDIAKRAERAYRFELGLLDSSFIQFGYWDSLKKGLLAGEKLGYDLRRMEISYLEQNKREYEMTKHISLALLDPISLVKLRENGECFVNLPESIFDVDCPGHYMRRIKSISLSIPCVTGPYTTVNCTLTLLKNSFRKVSTLLDGNYSRQENDPRFADSVGAIQSIVTSGAQNDSGVFDLNFQDERYLPFEGAGAVSEWRIELSKEKDFRQFDYDTISDVVLHLKYTSREGGNLLKEKAIEDLKTTLEEATLLLAENRTGLFRLFSARHEFSSEWNKFLHPLEIDNFQTLKIDLTQMKFPFQFRNRTIHPSQLEFFLKLKEDTAPDEVMLFLTPEGQVPDENSQVDQILLQTDPLFGGLLHGIKEVSATVPVSWWLSANQAAISSFAGFIEDIIFVCRYTIE